MKHVHFALALPLPLALALALALSTTACITENPTDVGDALLAGDNVLTFELLLPASEFLENDTSFSGYEHPREANYRVVANKFETVLDANALYRFSNAPSVLQVRTTGTTVASDSSPRYFSGRVVVKFDTTASSARPVRFRLYHTAQEWDPSATWTNRVDTTNTRLPWTTPGGTRGAQIDSAVTWSAGDSIVFTVDSTSLAQWNDSTNRGRGALLVSETPGSRVRVVTTTLRAAARSSIRSDTVINVDLPAVASTFLLDPTLATPHSGIRVGGLPAWRSFLRLRSDLRTRRFACTGGPAGCSVSLDSAHINIAELMLAPSPSPLGFMPEDTVIVDARSIVTSNAVPLERSPVQKVFARSGLIAPNVFRAPASTDVVRLNITTFIMHQLEDAITSGNRIPPVLALMQIPEGSTQGFMSFASTPTLRLVVTTSLERR